MWKRGGKFVGTERDYNVKSELISSRRLSSALKRLGQSFDGTARNECAFCANITTKVSININSACPHCTGVRGARKRCAGKVCKNVRELRFSRGTSSRGRISSRQTASNSAGAGSSSSRASEFNPSSNSTPLFYVGALGLALDTAAVAADLPPSHRG